MRRRFGPRLRAVFKSGCLILVCVVFGVYIAGFFAIPRLAQAKLQKQFGAAARVQSGSFTFPGRIRLKGVAIAEDQQALADNPILSADRIDITLHPIQLLMGRVVLSSISLNDFLFLADRDQDKHQWNFQRLAFDRNTSSVSAGPILVKLNRGAVKIRQQDEGVYRAVALFSLGGQIAADPKKNTYNFSFHSENKFGYAGSELQGVFSLNTDQEPGRFGLTGRLQMPGAKILNNAWNLDDIRIDCRFSPEMLDVTAFGFKMGSGDLTVSGRVDLSQQALSDVRIKLNGLAMSETFVPDTIVYSQAEKLVGAGLWEFFQRFHPAGSGDLDMVINGPLRQFSDLSAEGTIHSRDVSVQDDSFPYRIEHLEGDIVLSGGSLEVGPLTADHGDVEMVIAGTIKNFAANASMDLRTTSENMRLDDDLYWALKDPIDKRMWTWFAPSGITGIDNRFQMSPDGHTSQTLELHLKSVNAIYSNFPYALENLTGTIIMENGRIRIDNVAAIYDDERNVTISGEVIDFKNPKPAFRIDVDAVNIPLDDRLIRALPNDRQTLFDALQIDGRGDFKVQLFSRQDPDPFYDYVVSTDLTASKLLYEPFPLAMSDVRLHADVTRERIDIHTFDADTPEGRISLSGQVQPEGTDPEQPGVCLALGLRHFDLDEMFWNAAGTAAEEMLGKLRLSGPVDIAGQLTHNFSDASCGDTDLTVECTNNPVIWDQNSIGLTTGRFILEKDRVRFEEFHLAGIDLAAIPEAVLSEQMRTFYQAISPSGSVNVLVADGFAELSPDGPERIDLSFRADCNDVLLGLSDTLHIMDGTLDGRIMTDLQSNQGLTEAVCTAGRMSYGDWTVDHLQGDLKYDPAQTQLDATNLTGQFYGGSVSGEFNVGIVQQTAPHYTLGFRYQDVDLVQLLKRKSVDPASKPTQGRASGLMTLEGPFGEMEKSKGVFTSTIENLKIGTQSFLGKILTAVQLKEPQDYVFSRIEVDATAAGSELQCHRVRIVGDPLIFQGSGTVNIKEETMDMQFVAWDQKMGTEDTILDMIARGIGSALWRLEMKGDISEPKIDSVYLSVLKQPLDIFKKKNNTSAVQDSDGE